MGGPDGRSPAFPCHGGPPEPRLGGVTSGRRTAALLAFAVLIAACAPVYVPQSTYPPAGSTPQPAGGSTSAATQAVLSALATAGLQATVAASAYRPAEGPLLAAAPRTVLQVTMPDDPA